MKVASLALALAASAASATTVYVNVNSPAPAAPYDSWANACDDIATAVSYAAGNGADEVLVTNGTYALSSTIQLNGAIALRSVGGAAATILDGQNAVRPLELNNASAVVSGFTVTNGYAASGDGGGAKVSAGTISQSVFARNTANDGFGGGIYLASGLVDGCTIVHNLALGNNAGSGGGITVWGSGTVRSCLIEGNEAQGDQGHLGGGGLYLMQSPTIDSCTIVGNYDRDDLGENDGCGGIYVGYGGASPIIRNCIVRDNHVGDVTHSAVDFFVHGQSTGSQNPLCSHNCFGTAVVGTDPISPDPSDPVDPLFVSNGSGFGLARVLGDCHIPLYSPCARSGLVEGWMSTALDADGNPRIAPTTDKAALGAYSCNVGALGCYFTPSATVSDAPATITFTATIECADPANARLTYSWDFDGDGTPDRTGAESEVAWTYTGYGRYYPTLSVVNAADGATASAVCPSSILLAPNAVYVSPNGNETAPYNSLETATRSIATAVASAAPGMTILLDSATYALGATVALDSGVTMRSINPSNPAVLDGQGAVRCVSITHADAVLCDVVVSNGYLNGSSALGAGVYMSAGTVRDCTITGCYNADGSGGGAYVAGGLLYKCVLEGNSAGSSPWGGNGAGGGAGVGGTGVIRGCLIVGNSCQGNQGHLGGGGVFLDCGGTLESCTVTGNNDINGGGHDGGGGIFLALYAGTRPLVRNCIVYGNVSAGSTKPDCSTWNNNVNYDADHVCSPIAFGTDAVTGDPLFADAANGDYSLADGSPCAFAGSNQAWMAGETALGGNPRIDSGIGICDIGAYATAARPLVVSFHAEYASHLAPMEVVFIATVAGTATNNLTYTWDFDGDGNPDRFGANLARVTHTYATAGVFSPSLTVSNSDPAVTVVATLQSPIAAIPETMYVSTTGSDTAPYMTPATAAARIEDALALAGQGSTILVAPGVYAPASTLALPAGVSLIGSEGPASTIVDGMGTVQLVILTNDTSFCSGLTLTNGLVRSGDKPDSPGGGGAYITAGTLQDCVVIGCAADDGDSDGSRGGGGIMVSGTGMVLGCIVAKNTAGVGGGILATTGGTIRNCLIAGNYGEGGQGHVGGGGVMTYNGSTLIENCTIVGNSDGGHGGDSGGGYYHFLNATTLRNCIVAGNSPVDVYHWADRNETVADHCFVGTGYGDVPAELTGDPKLRNVGGAAGLGYNFADCRLLPDSPCVNAGATLSWMEDATDLEGNPRAAGAAPDIGCYEFRVQGTAILLR